MFNMPEDKECPVFDILPTAKARGFTLKLVTYVTQ